MILRVMFWVVMDEVEVVDVVSGGSISYFGVSGGVVGGGGGRAVRSRGGNVCGIGTDSVSYFSGGGGGVGGGGGGGGGGGCGGVCGSDVGSRFANSCRISGGSVRYFGGGGGGGGCSGANGGDSDSGYDVWRGGRRGEYRTDSVGIYGGDVSVIYVPGGGCGAGGYFNN